MKQSLKALLKYLLEQPEANSRFIFLLQGIAGAICILIIGIAFVIPKVADKALFPDMVLALSACTGSAAAGRWLTKKVGPQNQKDDDPKT